jgi:hypothetical protein
MASKTKRSTKVQKRVVVRPVRPVAAAAITPVHIVHGGAIPDGQAALPQTKYTVPAGKTLAIEFVAVSGAVPDGQRLAAAVGTIVNRVIGYYTFPTTAYSTNPAYRTDSIGNQPVRIYADAGTDVTIWASRTGGETGSAVATVLLSGYLFDV